MERMLDKEKLFETVERVAHRIAERFPQSGLSRVAVEVGQITREAAARAESIRRPNLWLRVGLVLLFASAVGLLFVAWEVQTPEERLNRVAALLDASKGVAAYLAAGVFFLWTLETRLKRRRALTAVHELRAMAHIIDMHQLTKDPDRALEEGPLMVSGKLMDADAMGSYLHYCTELLALVSKVGQLYVQDFPDPTAVAAVDQFENLATGLSGKIWQKIMILDRIQSEAEEAVRERNESQDGPAPAPMPAQ